jgi:hypothetical protein
MYIQLLVHAYSHGVRVSDADILRLYIEEVITVQK